MSDAARHELNELVEAYEERLSRTDIESVHELTSGKTPVSYVSHVSPEETMSASPGSSETEDEDLSERAIKTSRAAADRVRWAGQLWDSENVSTGAVVYGPEELRESPTGPYYIRELRPAHEVHRELGIPPQREPEEIEVLRYPGEVYSRTVRPDGIPAERIPEPELQLQLTVTPDVQISLDRIQESLDSVSESLRAILRSFEGFVGDLVAIEETETHCERGRGAASRSDEERTPDGCATGTPDREPHTTEPGGASLTEVPRSTDARWELG